ncbi:MAG: pentalenene synthase [Caldivirga sp.]
MDALIVSEVELPRDFALMASRYFDGLIRFTVVNADLSGLWRSYLDPRRGQVRADLLLSAIGHALRAQYPGFDRYVAVVNADGYVPGLNFVFGVAEGDYALVFTARLLGELLVTRILKEVIHEVGHTLGLGHCENPSCVMHFSNTLMDTDRKGPGFCPRCMVKVRRALIHPH